MGSGEVGGGGSVHWKVVTDESKKARGRAAAEGADLISFNAIGKKKKHLKKFKVKLRYQNSKAAANALAKAQTSPVKGKGAYVELTVDAINRKNPWDKLPWEIRIDW
jgi:methionine synthase I (cobalamin-dependent)